MDKNVAGSKSDNLKIAKSDNSSASRRAAAFALARWLSEKTFAEELLPSGPDRAFVQDVVYTAIRRWRTLDFVLGKFMVRRPKGELEALLLAGAAQILFMPSVPDFAAVHETVEAAKKSTSKRNISGVVNAVLRNIVRRKEELLCEIASLPLALRESYPDYLIDRWTARYGQAVAEKLARWHNQAADTFLAFPDGRYEVLGHGRSVAKEPGYGEGAFIVQNPATALAVDLLLEGAAPGAKILDFCAAPGGKTTQIWWKTRGNCKLCAYEVNPRRRRRLAENLERCRVEAEILESVPDGALFDRVLADVPCSNTGVLRKRPDARWRWNSTAWMAQLAAVQAEILEKAASHTAPGGVLVYSTCSNEPEENRERVERFLASPAGRDFTVADICESLPALTGKDGAFAVSLKRKGA